MKNIRSLALAASLFAISLAAANALTITENFAHDPALDGWQAYGDTNLFQWDSTNHVLDVTWDSTQTNSYFYLPLTDYLTKNDDFVFSFDLTLWQAETNNATGSLALALGFLNLTNASDPGFDRGGYPSPNVAEFDYYPNGFYPPIYPEAAAALPGFVDSTSSAYSPDFIAPYDLELPTNVLMHIVMAYTASNETASLTITTNGIPLAQLPDLLITSDGNGGFTDAYDYQVNIFSVTSYGETSADDDVSIFAQGAVGNLVVTLPPPAQNLAVSFAGGQWQVQFFAHPNWQYTLEHTVDFKTWTAVSPTIPGIMGNLILQDTSAPANSGFYRVYAERP